MWSALPYELQYEVVCSMGGNRLCETVRLSQASSPLRALASKAVHNLLRASDADVRAAALGATIAAAEIGVHGATHLLVNQATRDEDSFLRRTSIEALAYVVEKGSPEAPAVAAAVGRALSDSDMAVRRAALSTLQATVERGNVTVVKCALDAVSAAKWCGNDEGGQRLQDSLEAIATFALPGNHSAVEEVMLLVEDVRDNIRQEALATLGEVAAPGHPEVVALLCENLGYPDLATRRVAAYASAKVALKGDAHVIAALVRCLQEDVQSSMRIFALNALAVVARPCDVPAVAVADSHLNHEDISVRGAARRAKEVFTSSVQESD